MIAQIISRILIEDNEFIFIDLLIDHLKIRALIL